MGACLRGWRVRSLSLGSQPCRFERRRSRQEATATRQTSRVPHPVSVPSVSPKCDHLWVTRPGPGPVTPGLGKLRCTVQKQARPGCAATSHRRGSRPPPSDSGRWWSQKHSSGFPRASPSAGGWTGSSGWKRICGKEMCCHPRSDTPQDVPACPPDGRASVAETLPGWAGAGREGLGEELAWAEVTRKEHGEERRQLLQMPRQNRTGTSHQQGA